MMDKIVLASGNPGKLKEFQDLLADIGKDVRPQSEFNVPDAEETGLTFIENAIIKARNACIHTSLPAIADDSGIEVDALNGAPGIYSARYSADVTNGNANDEANNQKILDELAQTPEPERTARYQCVLVYMKHENDPTPIIAHGAWEGRILRERVGNNGFGYDPLFWVPTHECSSAQLDKDEKNRISHRAIAMASLIGQLKSLKNKQ